MSKKLLEDECIKEGSLVEAAKARAKLSGASDGDILEIDKLASNEANPNKKINPYTQITQSLTRFPLFIQPSPENYLLFLPGVCDKLKKPFYAILGWQPHLYKEYIAVTKIQNCPTLDDLDPGFPYITNEQYNKLREGYYWTYNKDYLSTYIGVEVFEVSDLTDLDDAFKKLFAKIDKDEFNSSKKQTAEITSGVTINNISTSNNIHDATQIDTYGVDKVGLFKSAKGCFIAIMGRNASREVKAVALWNPKYPSWLIIYPDVNSVSTALIVARSHIDLKKEIPTQSYLKFNTDPNTYPLYGVSNGQSFIRLSLPPINTLSYKLVDADYITFTSTEGNSLFFGLYGFTDALEGYNKSCSNN